MTRPAALRVRRQDPGFTLVELLIAVAVLGILMSTISAAIVVTLRTTPDTERRLDDARSTRSLATWLSHDTTSAPPFLPEREQGGVDVSTAPSADNNDCGGAGTNLLHLQWTEDSFLHRTYVANYRFVVDSGDGEIIRYSCSKPESAAFGDASSLRMVEGIDPSAVPTVTPHLDPAGDVESVTFELDGQSGERVFVETSSRNPADFFPEAAP